MRIFITQQIIIECHNLRVYIITTTPLQQQQQQYRCEACMFIFIIVFDVRFLNGKQDECVKIKRIHTKGKITHGTFESSTSRCVQCNGAIQSIFYRP